MMTEYEPAKRLGWRSKAANTRTCRLSYALGIVYGIGQAVEECLKREEEDRKRKLTKARLAVSRGEAYEESDNEEELDDDKEGKSYSISSQDAPNENQDLQGTSSVAVDTVSEDDLGNSEANGDSNNSKTTTITGEALQRLHEELEKEDRAALALVDHSEKIAEEVLKDNDIKLSKGRKRKAILMDRSSYRQGVEDSKEIDINQRAIRQEMAKVKTEKT